MRTLQSMRAGVLAATLALSSLAACRTADPYAEDADIPERVVLNVKNESFLDMDVYAVSSGLPTRIGNAPGLGTAKFSLSPALYNSSDFRVVAAPIGGNGRASSGALILRNGQHVNFTITSNLRASHAEVRDP